jgi:hypothetical protein
MTQLGSITKLDEPLITQNASHLVILILSLPHSHAVQSLMHWDISETEKVSYSKF